MPRDRRTLVLALLLATVVGVGAARTSAAGTEFWTRVGGVSQGPQGTFKKGLDLAAGFDFRREGATTLGVGFGWVSEPDRSSYTTYEGRMWTVEAHVRSTLWRTPIRPVIELGVGYSNLHLESQWQGSPPEVHDSNGPGGFAGLSLESTLSPGLVVSLEGRYHNVVTDFSGWGSNSEDYFSIGGSLRVALGGR